MNEKRFIIPDGDLETDVTLIDTVTGKEYTDNFEDIVELLNELHSELEWRRWIESKLRRKIAIITNGQRYTYFKGHSGWGVSDNVDPLNDESPYPSLICVVSSEEEAKRLCSYLNEYEKDAYNIEKFFHK